MTMKLSSMQPIAPIAPIDTPSISSTSSSAGSSGGSSFGEILSGAIERDGESLIVLVSRQADGRLSVAVSSPRRRAQRFLSEWANQVQSPIFKKSCCRLRLQQK